MCGIFYITTTDQNDNISFKNNNIINSINSIQHRGPDITTIISRYPNEIMAFHRLCINGETGLSNQPMTLNGTTYLLCNGEIYNHEVLQTKYKVKCTTGSDCEIILHLFEKIGFENTVKELDGEFAIVLVNGADVYVSRDPYGVRALYISNGNTGRFGVASECKALYALFKPSDIRQFMPGTILKWRAGSYTETKYYEYQHTIIPSELTNPDDCFSQLRNLLIDAVKKRMMCSRKHLNEQPAIGAYLSGGFDSSAIAAILQSEIVPPNKLETFSIGFVGSPDLHYARKVAEFIGSQHHEYIITERQALEAIPGVVRSIESYDITTVRASTMMYLLSEYVRENSKVVVLLSGEGSDEASGSYRYFHNAPSHDAFHREAERLLKDLCFFDNLRADKSSAAWGLEVRVPFLDLDFLKYYMTLARDVKTQEGIEKYALRKCLEGYLPEEILYRPKEAMSDGVSYHGRSWSTIIQEEARELMDLEDGLNAEKEYYMTLFQKHYFGCEQQIPYYWLPKWCGDVKDPSARVLSIYNAN